MNNTFIISMLLFVSPCMAQNIVTLGDNSKATNGEIEFILPRAVPLNMVLIRGGTFMIGSPPTEQKREDNEGPQCQVTITRDFYMGKYEVTQAQWEAVMGNNPSHFEHVPNHPVNSVSWLDCAAYCNRLSAEMNRTSAYDESDWTVNLDADGFRLPTEAEWEYACRAGTTTRFAHGDVLDCTEDGLCYTTCDSHNQHMWYCGSDNPPDGAESVGLLLPNSWGLYDMHGNVEEWCHDWYYRYYPSVPVEDPTGENHPHISRVTRGGSVWDMSWRCRSAYRDANTPTLTNAYLGFRIVFSQTTAVQNWRFH